MTLEVDIIVGVRENHIRYIDGPNSSVREEKTQIKINFSTAEKDLVHLSNRKKIEMLEAQFDKYEKIIEGDSKG